MLRQIFLLLTLYCLADSLVAQPDTIRLKNGSFEDTPMYSKGVKGWQTCGPRTETPPDVQPFRANLEAAWGQLIPAHKGNTYLGMVVRDNDTYESVAQRLQTPLRKGNCYSFSIWLSSSDHYISQSHKTKQLANYVKPVVLRIWGGNDYCGRRELLAESPTISNKSWERYDFEFHLNGDYSFIMLEAFYKTPTLIVYNGNILLDGASEIIQINCPGEELLAVVEEDSKEEEEAIINVHLQGYETNTKTNSDPEPEPEEVEVATASTIPSPKPPETRILKNLERDKIVKGQTIRIENLYFDADSATMDEKSHDVLEEIAYFLSQNKDVVIEIGGHTNGLPKDDFADRLSEQRAQSVANYMLSRGIDESQLKFKGYGRRKPLASNRTKWGRERNQRVEMRILSIRG